MLRTFSYNYLTMFIDFGPNLYGFSEAVSTYLCLFVYLHVF